MASLWQRSSEFVESLLHRQSVWLAERDARKAAERAARKAAKRAARLDSYMPAGFDPATEPWPPVWKPIGESPQFRYGVIDSFDVAYYHIDESHKDSLKQILESRGYDVDYFSPRIVNNPLHRVNVDLLEKKEPKYYGVVMDSMKYAFAQINIHAEMNGERYELLELERLVEALANRTSLITFSVKQVAPDVGVIKSIQAMVYCEFRLGVARYQLIEWRFKPEASV